MMGLILPWWWRWAALAAICAASWGHGYVTATKHQESRVAACKEEFAGFKAQTKAIADRAAAVAKAKETTQRQIQEDADHENARTTADLRARLERLRRSSSGNVLPAAPAGAGRPDLACYDRAELERAAGSLLADLRDLADEGSQAAVDLNTAREWAARLKVAESMAVR